VYTPALLDFLKRHDIRATFFVVGERARRYLACGGDLFRGHEIVNHTDTWRNTLRLPIETFEQDLVRAEQTTRAQRVRDALFPARGNLDHVVATRSGGATPLPPVLGSAYATIPSGRGVLHRLGDRPGTAARAIIVIHDSGGERSRTLQALPAIVRAPLKSACAS